MIRFWIGGLDVCLEADASLPPPGAAAYQPFLYPPAFVDVRHDCIRGRVIETDPPESAGAVKIFDTGRTWALFRGSDGAYFFIHRRGEAGYPWVQAGRFDVEKGMLDLYAGAREWRGRGRLPHPFEYPLDQVALMYFLAARRGVIVHGAGAVLDGEGCLFAGRSGAGKSTISGIIREGLGADVLSDDRVIVRFDDAGAAWMYGTPWPGSAGIARNERVRLRHIFFLRHAKVNAVVPAGGAGGVARLMPVVSVPWFDPVWSGAALQTCGDMLEACRTSVLDFTPDKRVLAVVAGETGKRRMKAEG